MNRRVGAHGSASRAPLGEDLGLFRGSFDGTGTAPQSASITAPWSNGRTLVLQAQRSGSESRRGSRDQEIVGATVLKHRSPRIATQGFGPQAMTAKLNIACRPNPFNSKGSGHEHLTP